MNRHILKLNPNQLASIAPALHTGASRAAFPPVYRPVPGLPVQAKPAPISSPLGKTGIPVQAGMMKAGPVASTARLSMSPPVYRPKLTAPKPSPLPRPPFHAAQARLAKVEIRSPQIPLYHAAPPAPGPAVAQPMNRFAPPPAPAVRSTPVVSRVAVPRNPIVSAAIQARLLGPLRFGNRIIPNGKIYSRVWLQDCLLTMGAYRYQVAEEVDRKYGSGTWNGLIAAIENGSDTLASERDLDCIQLITEYATRAQRDVRDQPTPLNIPNLALLETSSSVPFTFSTQNIEKYGKATKKAQKTNQIRENMDTTNSDIATFQEVTDSKRFLGDLGPQLPGYQGLEGPRYQSGNYTESYPSFFNEATVHQRPQLFYIDPQTGEEHPYSRTLYFGTEAARRAKNSKLKQARPTTFWQLQLPSGRRNLRPAVKGFEDSDRERYSRLHVNLKHRVTPYRTVRWINVHTSPGKTTPTIHQQVNQILSDQERMRRLFPNTGSSGDYYMQRGSRRNFSALERGRRGLRSVHPGVNTNFKKGEGKQIADHFVLPESWQGSQSWAIPPSKSFNSESLESKMQRGTQEDQLSQWENYGIDHSKVYGYSQVPEDPIERLVNEIVLRYLQDQRYRTNNCLIFAIANAAGVQVSQQQIDRIRQTLSRTGTGIGQFIAATDNNIRVIMHELGLYGMVYIVNADNVHHVNAPVFVPGQGTLVDLTINYSRDHFFATPGDKKTVKKN